MRYTDCAKQLAAPKSKYIEHILVATHTGEAGVAEIFRTLHIRLRESTWTVVFKALIVIHLMIREGQLDATLHYLSENPSKLAISQFSEGEWQKKWGEECILTGLQCSTRVITSGDTPIISWRAREYSKIQRPTMCEAGRGE